MTKEEITICKMYLEEMGKDKDCNEYKLLMQMLEQQPSDDCVSRKALINSYNGIETPVGYRKVVDMQVIEALPPVTPTQKWIPVSERLPKVGEKVLCQCQANIYEVLKLTVDGWFYDNKHCYMSGFVIAWQPLPKPYTEKRGNENDI